ncbi:MAG: ATP synthase F0 subunit B [Bacteroidetes bacterium]|nr:MAG: ATP synthase F0 subunit B [Bacteroidota bacterium]PTM11712.1 MAG: ATP synthase F0 subunit B [Bacteroidota bacterium]
MNIFLLAEFSVIRPDPGLIFWTALIFIVLWGVLGRMAFKPIQNALTKRDNDIQEALDEAKRAREEMANLQAENQKILAQAREERSKILKEAKETKDQILKEAKEQARTEARKIVVSAQQEIENQRQIAVTELKNQVGQMAITIAEKVLRKQLTGANNQEAFVNTLVDEIKLN